MNRMTRSGLLLFIAVIAASSAVHGADIRYKQSGDWFDVESVTGTNGWLSPGLPGVADTARFNWGGNTVTLAGVAPTVNRVQLGVDESGTLVVNSGGHLTTLEDVDVGHNDNDGTDTGTLIVNDGGRVDVGRILWTAHLPGSPTGNISINTGGVVEVASHLWWGVSGTSTVDISGTLMQTGGILGLGTDNAVSPTGGAATVNILDGGLMALFNIDGSGNSIFAGSSINISGSGQMTIAGDVVGSINTHYLDDISGNGLLGNVSVSYDMGNNLTIVQAVPEPTSGILFGLCLLGALIARRR